MVERDDTDSDRDEREDGKNCNGAGLVPVRTHVDCCVCSSTDIDVCAADLWPSSEEWFVEEPVGERDLDDRLKRDRMCCIFCRTNVKIREGDEDAGRLDGPDRILATSEWVMDAVSGTG